MDEFLAEAVRDNSRTDTVNKDEEGKEEKTEDGNDKGHISEVGAAKD